jgi:hypothetical protein
VYTTIGYDPTRPSHGGAADEAWARLDLVRRRYVVPGFVIRLGLRIFCAVPWLSYRVRAMIDRYRIRNRTAGNQSATARAAARCGVSVLRLVDVGDDSVTVSDRVRVTSGEVQLGELAWADDAGLAWLADLPFEDAASLPTRLPAGAIHEFRQEYRIVAGDPARVEPRYSHRPGRAE